MFPVPIGELGASTHLLTSFALLLRDVLSHLQECLGDLEQYPSSMGTEIKLSGGGEPSTDLTALGVDLTALRMNLNLLTMDRIALRLDLGCCIVWEGIRMLWVWILLL